MDNDYFDALVLTYTDGRTHIHTIIDMHIHTRKHEHTHTHI
jgi:hypothetical protein